MCAAFPILLKASSEMLRACVGTEFFDVWQGLHFEEWKPEQKDKPQSHILTECPIIYKHLGALCFLPCAVAREFNAANLQ